MKKSKYNFIIDKGDASYWFNGITQFHFKLNTQLSKKLESNIENPDIIKENAPNFYNQLIEKGFLISKDLEEVDIIRENNKLARESKNYFLILLPTLDCNFECWYCIQEHIYTKMDDTTIEKVKRHIEHVVKVEKVSSLHIEWFGGEPFMFYDEVIKHITKFSVSLCESEGIPFIATATTNGYFLAPTIHEELEYLNFKRFQITLDGVRKEHNKVKFSKKGDSAFDVTLSNVNLMLLNTRSITVLLRINYTEDNLKEEIITEVNEIIDAKNRSKIEVMFRRVWQEEVDKNRNEKIFTIADAFEKDGYCKNRFDLDNGFLPCYTNKLYYNAINYDGSVVKCTACDDLYSKNPPGRLNDEGQIIWEEGFLDKFYKIRYENDSCINCKYLPICMGNCGLGYQNELNEEFSCKSKGYDSSFEEIILHYIEKEYEV